tara:strand:- start:304 stop:675 length:372 start_codon:yes stop_codon:yes gene_type:complete
MEFLAGATGAELGPAARIGRAAPCALGFDDGEPLEFHYEGGGDFDDGEEFHYEGDDVAGGMWGEGAAEAAEQAAVQRQPGAARLSGAKRPREAGELGRPDRAAQPRHLLRLPCTSTACCCDVY